MLWRSPSCHQIRSDSASTAKPTAGTCLAKARAPSDHWHWAASALSSATMSVAAPQALKLAAIRSSSTDRSRTHRARSSARSAEGVSPPARKNSAASVYALSAFARIRRNTKLSAARSRACAAARSASRAACARAAEASSSAAAAASVAQAVEKCAAAALYAAAASAECPAATYLQRQSVRNAALPGKKQIILKHFIKQITLPTKPKRGFLGW
jgi:hypothetical protein